MHKVFFAVIFLLFLMNLSGQSTFDKPQRPSKNLLNLHSPSLKTIYPFKPSHYDTVQREGENPLIVSKYGENKLIQAVFNAVFSNQIKVYNPNFWGSIPQLTEKPGYEVFDTLEILNYLSAGWDTSLMIDNNGTIESYPEYREIPYEEISGIFFYESWWLDQKDFRFYKDILAYLPIREYLSTVYEGYENTELRRRLLFMVIPEWSGGTKKSIKYKPGNFQLLSKDISYDVQLYNKPYEVYLYREEEDSPISQMEYKEWQYHHFDFYRNFDADVFLEKIITGILDGHLNAYPLMIRDFPMDRKEFIKMLRNEPEFNDSILLPEEFPLGELNSITFHEDWYIHPGSMQIYKDVKGITLNRHEARYDNFTGEFHHESITALFSVWF